MALDKTALAEALKAIFEDLDGTRTAADKAAEVADAIDTFAKSGEVTFGAGQISGTDSAGDSHGSLTASGGTIS